MTEPLSADRQASPPHHRSLCGPSPCWVGSGHQAFTCSTKCNQSSHAGGGVVRLHRTQPGSVGLPAPGPRCVTAAVQPCSGGIWGHSATWMTRRAGGKVGGGSWRRPLLFLSSSGWTLPQAGEGLPCPAVAAVSAPSISIQGWEEGGPGEENNLGVSAEATLAPATERSLSSCQGERGWGLVCAPPRPPGSWVVWAVDGSAFLPPAEPLFYTEKNGVEFFPHLTGALLLHVFRAYKSGNDPYTFRIGRWAQAGDEGDRSPSSRLMV